MPRRMLVLLSLVSLLLAGCLGRDQPALQTGEPLRELWRMPSPVAAWTYSDPENGLLGAGQRLASIDVRRGVVRWAVDLPETYALRTSSVLRAAGTLALLGYTPARDTPSSVRVLDAFDGRTLRDRALPPDTQVVTDGRDRLVLATCHGTGCDLTMISIVDGRTTVKQHLGERVTLTTGTECGCVYAAGPHTIRQIADGVVWTMRRPPGADLRLIPSLYRLTLFTPPVAPGCAATARGVDAATGRTVWTRTFRWSDAGAVGLPCSYSPDRVLTRMDHLQVPVAGAIQVLDTYHGTSTSLPLDPGEYLLPSSMRFTSLSWTPGAGYRDRGDPARPPAPLPAPDDGRPWADDPGTSLWLVHSGDGLTLYHPSHGIRWHHPYPTALLTNGMDWLVYLDGTTLIALTPRSVT